MYLNTFYTFFTTKRLTNFILLLLTTAACVAQPAAISPSRRVSLGNERARYDFNDNLPTVWQTFTAPGSQALFQVSGGALEGAVIPNRGYIWSLNGQRYNNVSIQASVQQTKGSFGNGFGLLCRADGSGNGYYFVISSAGQFAILKGTPAHTNPSVLLDWQTSDLLRPEFQTNTLQAVCAGDYLAFFANNRFLGEAIDTDYYVGELGVVLGAVGETAWVRFDNIIVRDANPLNR